MNRSLAIGAALLLAAAASHSAEPNQLASLRHAVKTAETTCEAARKAAEVDFAIWLDKAPEGPTEPTLEGEIARFTFESLADGRIPNVIRNGPAAIVQGKPSFGDGKVGKCFVFDSSNGFSVPKIQGFHKADEFTLGCWLRVDGRPITAPLIQTAADTSMRGFSLRIVEGKIVISLVHSSPDNALVVVSRNALPSDRWTHLAATYDGSSKATGIRAYVDGTLAPLEIRQDSLTRDIASDRTELSVGATGNELRGLAIDEFRVFQLDLTSLEIAALAGREDYREAVQSIPEPSAEQRIALFEYYVATSNDATKEALNALRAARKTESDYLESVSSR